MQNIKINVDEIPESTAYCLAKALAEAVKAWKFAQENAAVEASE